MEPTQEQRAGRRRWRFPRPKLHVIYFVLAAFDFLTVCGGLYLSHQIMAIYKDSVRVNQEWADRLTSFSKLSSLASAVNAPGNDVFDSRDVTQERTRRDEALINFTKQLEEVRIALPAGMGDLNNSANRIERAMTEMIAEADRIFEMFEAGRADEAAARMATMDRKYAVLGAAVNDANLLIQEIQASRFKNQLESANGLRHYEYLIGVLIVLMVGCVSFYGHKIGQVMRRSEEERERLLEALAERERLAQSRLNDAIESMPEGFALYDHEDRLLMCNHQYGEMFVHDGRDLSSLVGMTFAEITRIELANYAYRISSGREDQWLDERLFHHRDATGDVLVEINDGRWLRLYDRRTSEGGIVVLAFDVTERIEDERRLEYLAHHDELTGLPNRMSFFKMLEEELQGRDADLTKSTVAVHYVDLDHFKRINDTLGHEAGDFVLKEVAGRLLAAAGERAYPCRLGGDEFAVLQLVGSDDGEVARLANATLEILREPIIWRGHSLVVQASIGLACSNREVMDALSLTKQADLALYAAKGTGRNAYRTFDDSISERHERRLHVESAIRGACEQNSFELHYQPVLELATARLTGFEALLRLPKPGGGYISPAEFIPVAEDMGKIDEIGAWCLEEACRTASHWGDSIVIAVNLSTLQFRSGGLVANVEKALELSQLAPHRLELEITESVLLEDSDSVQKQLRELKALGVRVSLDDFGTGYSALNYLWRFPLDKIKIDRSFIQALEDNENAKDVLGAIVDLGRRLHVPIVAEGVETEEQRKFLLDLDCSLGQGYLFGKPAPVADLSAIVLRNFVASLPASDSLTQPSEETGTSLASQVSA